MNTFFIGCRVPNSHVFDTQVLFGSIDLLSYMAKVSPRTSWVFISMHMFGLVVISCAFRSPFRTCSYGETYGSA